MTREVDWQQTVAMAVTRVGALHILVNNAGTGTSGKVEEVALAEWNRVMDINASC